jgi:hypothetical protein
VTSITISGGDCHLVVAEPTHPRDHYPFAGARLRLFQPFVGSQTVRGSIVGTRKDLPKAPERLIKLRQPTVLRAHPWSSKLPPPRKKAGCWARRSEWP